MSAKIKGNLALLGAVCIWSGWMIQTRFLSSGGTSPYDLAALRFSFAALFLLPVTINQGLILKDGSLVKSLILTTCLGFPYMLLVASGMQFAPAADGASIINGALILASAVFSYFLINESKRPLNYT